MTISQIATVDHAHFRESQNYYYDDVLPRVKKAFQSTTAEKWVSCTTIFVSLGLIASPYSWKEVGMLLQRRDKKRFETVYSWMISTRLPKNASNNRGKTNNNDTNSGDVVGWKQGFRLSHLFNGISTVTGMWKSQLTSDMHWYSAERIVLACLLAYYKGPALGPPHFAIASCSVPFMRLTVQCAYSRAPTSYKAWHKMGTAKLPACVYRYPK